VSNVLVAQDLIANCDLLTTMLLKSSAEEHMPKQGNGKGMGSRLD